MAAGEARPTRDEKKARTRERLLEAAWAVFARRGLAGASLDEIAEEAGLTKGAVYSNFGSKEELLLALLDEQFRRHTLEVLEEVDFAAPAAEQARAAGARFMAMIPKEEVVLGLEFLSYAARNAEFYERFATQHRESLRTMAEIISRTAPQWGFDLPLPADQLAVVFNALGTGLAIERLLDPERVPDELYGTVLALIYGFGQPEV